MFNDTPINHIERARTFVAAVAVDKLMFLGNYLVGLALPVGYKDGGKGGV